MIKTRFAPSPTGYLHIGGARTALFSWAYARQNGGQFLLRIEDTDGARSTKAHSEAIIHAMQWLGLNADAPPIFQSDNGDRHRQVVAQLLAAGKAYRCYCTPEELAEIRAAQTAAAQTPRYDRRWRDSDKPPPPNVAPAIRFKMPTDGMTTFDDAVKGRLSVSNTELDDFIICRSDRTPTYNLAAVVDDVDAEITHIIRGDDHVMNTYRQWHIFDALGWMPVFAHLPMIFAAESVDDSGQTCYVRMSKRNAAVDIAVYRRDGFLPQALCNYLARLSWAEGDVEVFSRQFFVEHFNFSVVSQSPARFDRDKLLWLNREHLRGLPPPEVRDLAEIDSTVTDAAIGLLINHAETLNDVRDDAMLFARPPAVDADMLAEHLPTENEAAFGKLCAALEALEDWQAETIKTLIRDTVKAEKLSFRDVAMPMRIALFGKTDSPDIAAAAAALGKAETLARLSAVVKV